MDGSPGSVEMQALKQGRLSMQELANFKASSQPRRPPEIWNLASEISNDLLHCSMAHSSCVVASMPHGDTRAETVSTVDCQINGFSSWRWLHAGQGPCECCGVRHVFVLPGRSLAARLEKGAGHVCSCAS